MCFNIFHALCGPEEALVIRSVGGSSVRFVIGGSALVWSFVETCERIPLNKIRLEVKTRKVFTARGVPISLDGVAVVRIDSSNEEALALAAEVFRRKSLDEIGDICMTIVEHHQREVLFSMTPEVVFINRKQFAKNVTTSASEDLKKKGVEILEFEVSDILGIIE